MKEPMECKPTRGFRRNELHLVENLNGHELDIDCWCEPQGTWTRHKHGILIFVVQHLDGKQTSHHHNIVAMRTLSPDPTTNFLNSIYCFEHER